MVAGTDTHRSSAIPSAVLAQGVIVGLLGVIGAALLTGATSVPETLRLLTAGICALQGGHLLTLGGTDLPLCARNTGIYLGLSLTLGTYFVRGRRVGWRYDLPRPTLLLVAAAFLLPLAFDGVNSLLFDLGSVYVYEPHNGLRLATGLLTGVGLGVVVWPATRYVLGGYGGLPTVQNPRDLATLLLLPGLALVAILGGIDVLLLPVAVASSAGLVVAVTVINRWVLSALSPPWGWASRNHVLWSLALLLGVLELLALSTARMFILPVG